MSASWHDPPGREIIDTCPQSIGSEYNEINKGADNTSLVVYQGTSESSEYDDDDDKENNDRYDNHDHGNRGMVAGLKHLYSGTEDKQGRFQWQDTIPEDIGDPQENQDTAKWALVVRNVRVYNDPSKVLKMHSLVIQSPLLKKLLTHVLKDYPGVAVSLDHLEFSGKFEPLIHRWAELQDAIGALGEDQGLMKQHAALLHNVLVAEFENLIDISQDMMKKRVMTFQYLWTLFQPGATIFALQDGQETALSLVSTRYGKDMNSVPVFELTYKRIDWDGVKFGTSTSRLVISFFDGTRPITVLKAYPLKYHQNYQAVCDRLIERGAKMESLAGPNYRAYDGIAWRYNANGGKDKYNIKGRIVIDTYEWNRFNPDDAIYVSTLNQKVTGQGDEYINTGNGIPIVEDEDSVDGFPGYDDADGMPFGGCFAEEDTASRVPLTDEQKLVCSPLLRGYSMKNKAWFNFFVSCVHDIEWQTDAFDRLVLPKNQKELILGSTQSQRKNRGTFDDVIKGKGRGMIILLCGPPGVGKTLTAESIAEVMKVPLYLMSAGDIGFESRQLEKTLQDIFEMCSRWNAVLLLDEADVFLEQRSMHDLQRNKLVSIFLRVLEYYEGTMFLTTNRVSTFDPAFQSRIHISLDYQELSTVSRKAIWENFLANNEEHTINKSEVTKLASMKINGRQIKNLLKTSCLLALQKEEKLSYGHIMTTFDLTQHLYKETQATEHTRGTLYG